MAVRQTQTIPNNVQVAGVLSAHSIIVPDSTILDRMISAAALIDAGKVVQRRREIYTQPNGTAIVAANVPIYLCRPTNGATLISIAAAITGAVATGNDRTVTVDLKKGNESTAPATVLSATLDFDDGTTLREVATGAFSDDELETDDMLFIVVTVAGAAGAQAQGLIVDVTIEDQPN